MLLQGFLERAAEQMPDTVGLVCDERRVTYAQLDAEANQLARALMSLGLGRNDRAVILCHNDVAPVLGLWATLKADGVFVIVSASIKADALAYIVNDCSARLLIAEASKASVVEQALPSCPSVVGVAWADAPAGTLPPTVGSLGLPEVRQAFDASRPPTRNIDVDLCALVYTSGSTGRPKGVIEAHHNVISACTSITAYLGNSEDDVILGALPFSSSYGLNQILTATRVGARVVAVRSTAFPYPIIEAMQRERVTGVPGVPTLFATLLSLSIFNGAELPHVRYITNAGAALPVPYGRQLRAAFPEARVYAMYGLTECTRVSYLPPEDMDRRPRSIGKGMPNEEVYIVDDLGNRVGPGVVGELVVRGSNVMRGYWGCPEDTALRYRPGPWPGETVLYTGDLFTMDEEGFLYFVGRTDDIIKSRGQKVSPREVEDILYELSQVSEAAVVPVDDGLVGQALHAYLVLKDGQALSESGVLRHCAGRLEEFKVPQRAFFKESFPRGATGKVDKRALKP